MINNRAVVPVISISRVVPTVLMALTILLSACSDSSSTPDAGFAGLGETSSDNFRQPSVDDVISLPQDLGVHPQHRIEWWYLTANLKTADGRSLGLQWTQFRRGLKAAASVDQPQTDWNMNAAWMSHAAVSVDGEHRFSERLARGGTRQAGATGQPFNVWLDDWQLREVDGSKEQWQLTVTEDNWSYNLLIAPRRDIVRHGQDGFSTKSADGQGSMYFSFVDLAIEGDVTLDGETYAVSGQGWFDREWSSQFLRADQDGWDWLALHLDSGAKVMAFRLRERDGFYQSGTWVSPTGEVRALTPDQLSLEPGRLRDTRAGSLPEQWQLSIPSEGLDITVTVPPGDYWNNGVFPYWESPVSAEGTHKGVGYLELTGYQE
ncbi:MAG: lipocalin-like domain-containing protein [Marinobacter sp.]|uniref:lipocalin-like domain-containing protein n=1 Tax=Marinobacter sp. TaxID=50741 RepID=UPI0034A01AFA